MFPRLLLWLFVWTDFYTKNFRNNTISPGNCKSNCLFTVRLTVRGRLSQPILKARAPLKILTHFGIEIWFFDTQNTFHLLVRGVKMHFSCPFRDCLIFLQCCYPSFLWQNSTSMLELRIVGVGWKRILESQTKTTIIPAPQLLFWSNHNPWKLHPDTFVLCNMRAPAPSQLRESKNAQTDSILGSCYVRLSTILYW